MSYHNQTQEYNHFAWQLDKQEDTKASYIELKEKVIFLQKNERMHRASLQEMEEEIAKLSYRLHVIEARIRDATNDLEKDELLGEHRIIANSIRFYEEQIGIWAKDLQTATKDLNSALTELQLFEALSSLSI